MRFYNITDEYINFLHQHDSKVAINKEESRPYIGAVLIINDMKYFAPLSSPKPKHLKMKNGKDFKKIDGGKLGAINLNNMIPVSDDALLPIEFDKISDVKYRELLRRQYKAIRRMESDIVSSASELRAMIMSDETSLSSHDLVIKSRCCDYAILETVFRKFQSSK